MNFIVLVSDSTPSCVTVCFANCKLKAYSSAVNCKNVSAELPKKTPKNFAVPQWEDIKVQLLVSKQRAGVLHGFT